MLKKLFSNIKQYRTVYFFLFPSVVIMLLIVGYPLLNTIYFSFTDMTDKTLALDDAEGRRENQQAITELGVIVPQLAKINKAQKEIVNFLATRDEAVLRGNAYDQYLSLLSNRQAVIEESKKAKAETSEGEYYFSTFYMLNLKSFLEKDTPDTKNRQELLAHEKRILSGTKRKKGIQQELANQRQTLADKKSKHPTRFVGLRNYLELLGLQKNRTTLSNEQAVLELKDLFLAMEKEAPDTDAMQQRLTRFLQQNSYREYALEQMNSYLDISLEQWTNSKTAASLPPAQKLKDIAILLSNKETVSEAFRDFSDTTRRLQRDILTILNKYRIPKAEEQKLRTDLKKLTDTCRTVRGELFSNDRLNAIREALGERETEGKEAVSRLRKLSGLFPTRDSSDSDKKELSIGRIAEVHTRLAKFAKRLDNFRTWSETRGLNDLFAEHIEALTKIRKRWQQFISDGQSIALPADLQAHYKDLKTEIGEEFADRSSDQPLLKTYLSVRLGEHNLQILKETPAKANLLNIFSREYTSNKILKGTQPPSDFGFWDIFLQTIIWTVVNVFLHFTIGLYLAHWLNRKLRGNTFYRAMLLVPWTVPNFVAAFSWRLIFDYPNGVLNRIIEGLGGIPQNFISDQWVLTACIIVNVWVGVPFMMITLLGGLQTIPEEQYEAASIDGANPLQKLLNVTLPGLRPVASVAVLLGFIWTFNMFNIIYLVTLGIEMNEKNILVTYAYDAFFKYFNFAESATYGVIILSLLLAFGSVYVRVLKKGGEI